MLQTVNYGLHVPSSNFVDVKSFVANPVTNVQDERMVSIEVTLLAVYAKNLFA